MINLKNIQHYSRQIDSNPIKAVRKVSSHIPARTHLESSPAVDTLVKVNPQNYILGAQPGKLIKEITKKKTGDFGKDAMVFAIPNQPDLVLRVEHTAIEKMDTLADSLKLIPIKHNDNLLAHKNLGLPLYSVVGKESELYAKDSIEPLEALRQKDNIMVLRKVSGENPANASWNALVKLAGCEDDAPNLPQYINFQQLTQIKVQYGKDAAKKCWKIIKEGGEQNIPENFFAPGSEAYTFTNCDVFANNYKAYSKSYINYLKQLSKMPKESFKEAVDTILMDKNFLIDFQHIGNTFVDFKNKKFNFMDFEFDKTNKKYIYDNPVREFKNVILGKCFSSIAKSPANILLEEKDIKTAQKYSDKIADIVNSVTPDKFKF